MADLLPASIDPANSKPAAMMMSDALGNTTQAAWANWLMNGANTDSLLGGLQSSILGGLINDPAAAKAVDLGIQGLQGADVTGGLENLAATQVLNSLPMNNEFKKLAEAALTGFNPMSVGMAFAPEMSQAFGSLLGFGQNSSVSKHTDTGSNVTQVNDNGKSYVVDNTTGKQYPSMAAYDFYTKVDALKAQGYPDNIAQMSIAADRGMLPQKVTDALTAQMSKLSGATALQGIGLADQIKYMYSLSTPGATTPEAKQIASQLDSFMGQDLSDPTIMKRLTDYAKSYGTIPADYRQKITDKYKADQQAYASNFTSGSPQIKSIVDKYTAAGAKAPAVGSLDSLVMAEYMRAPQTTIDKLGALYKQANGGKIDGSNPAVNVLSDIGLRGLVTFAPPTAAQLGTAQQINAEWKNFQVPYPNPVNDDQRSANMQASYDFGNSLQTKYPSAVPAGVDPTTTGLSDSQIAANKAEADRLAAATATQQKIDTERAAQADATAKVNAAQAATDAQIQAKNAAFYATTGFDPTAQPGQAANYSQSQQASITSEQDKARNDRLAFYIKLSGGDIDQAIQNYQAEAGNVFGDAQKAFTDAQRKPAPTAVVPTTQQAAPVQANPAPAQPVAAPASQAPVTADPKANLAFGVDSSTMGSIAPDPTKPSFTLAEVGPDNTSYFYQNDPTTTLAYENAHPTDYWKQVTNQSLTDFLNGARDQTGVDNALKWYQERGFTIRPDQQSIIDPYEQKFKPPAPQPATMDTSLVQAAQAPSPLAPAPN